MNNKYFTLTVFMIITGSALISFSCNVSREQNVEDAKQKVAQVNQDLKDAQTQFEKEWQQFKSDAEVKINANEKRIDEFKEKIKTAGNKFKSKYENEVTVLEQKNIELKNKMREYKYEGKDKWEEFKRGFNQDMDIVGKALKDIFSKKE